MKHSILLTVVLLALLCTARTAVAEPAWGVNCLSCHGEYLTDTLFVIDEDTTADPDESATGAPDRGELKVFQGYRANTKSLRAEVVGLDLGDTYAVELKRVRYPGVENAEILTYTPDCYWADWGAPGNYFSDPHIGFSWGTDPTVFDFEITLPSDMPYDYFDLVLAVAGKFTDGGLFYAEERFYFQVALMPGDYEGDGDVDLDDYDLFDTLECFTGPWGGPYNEGCEAGDFDGDNDIDCLDWNQFVLAWTAGGDPPELAECLLDAPLMALPPHDTRKNRYISFSPNSGTNTVAHELELTEGPGTMGVIGYIGEPYDPSCQNDDGTPNGGTCDGLDYLARVVNSPVFRTWPEELIHVGDCEIVPVATYMLRATFDALLFGDPLEVGTILLPPPHYFGDTVGVGTGDLPPLPGYTAPNQIVNVNDVSAYLLTADGPTTPSVHLTWVDLHGLDDGAAPNFILNVPDLQRILFGLEGQEYTDAPDQIVPSDCP